MLDVGAEWVLFVDWCAVTGHAPLPATAETVLMFFGNCPAAAGTFALRLSAIDSAHRDAGVTPPERTTQVRDVLRGRARFAEPVNRVASAAYRYQASTWIEQRTVPLPLTTCREATQDDRNASSVPAA